MISLLSLGLSTSYAQIGYLGIYGSVPETYRANTRYVNVSPNDTDNPTVQTLPVNGLKNFNFYYLIDGTGFLPGEHYTVSYLNASQSVLASEIVNYSPNSGHTNGTQVQTAFNIPQGGSSTLGIHANVYGYTSGGSVVALNNMTVNGTLGTDTVYARTNGNGYFSLYYAGGSPGSFLASGDHRQVLIYGSQNGCSYFHYESGINVIWSPDTNPNSSGYYVTSAEMDLTSYIPILSCGGLGD